MINFINALLLLLTFIMMSSHIVGNEEKRSDYSVSVLERILFPFLVDLSVSYKEAESVEEKVNLEYNIYQIQFVYWIHTHKFGEKRSSIIEQRFAFMNAMSLDSKSFLNMVRNRGMFFSDNGEFLGVRMVASREGNGEIRIEKNEREKFDQLTNEFIDFMERLRTEHLKRE